jgi:5-oxoprolinase (ATP-hydrolysing) subunit A
LRGRCDLNVDIGEGFPHDEELLHFASSANVCLGVHAGSEELTMRTIDLCLKKKKRIGLHPGYPDRETMGRASMASDQQSSYLKSIFDQTTKYIRVVNAAYIKPHGAFYTDTAVPLPEGWDIDPEDTPPRSRYQAGGVVLAQTPGLGPLGMLLRIHRLGLMGLPGTAHQEVAKRAHVAFYKEGFADRAYREDGTLIARSEPGAVLENPDQIREQVLRLALEVDSLCLHGDTPGCVEFAELVFATLRDTGYEVRP